MKWAISVTDCNAAYHFGGGLAALSQAGVGVIRFGGSRVLPTGFFLAVGDSTVSRKTAAVNLSRDIVTDADSSAIPEQVASGESLIAHLHRQSRRLLIYGEFGEFLAAAERGPLLALKTKLNSVWDGDSLGNSLAADVRKGANKGVIKNPQVSLLGGVTPDYLERHTESVDWTSGFFARFFFLYGKREREFHDPKSDLPTQSVLTQQLREKIAEAEERKVSPPVFRGMSPESRQLWFRWSDQLTARASQARFTAGITRAQNMALRIAYLLAIDYGNILGSSEWQLDIDELAPAIAIAELHIKSSYALGNLIAEDEPMKKRRAVLNSIAREPTPLSTIVGRSRLEYRQVKAWLESLQIEKVIEKVTMETDPSGDEFEREAETHYARIVDVEDVYVPPDLPKWVWNPNPMTPPVEVRPKMVKDLLANGRPVSVPRVADVVLRKAVEPEDLDGVGEIDELMDLKEKR